MIAVLFAASAVQLAQVLPSALGSDAARCQPQTPVFGTPLTESTRMPAGIGSGNPVVIILKSNPTTGYAWNLTTVPDATLVRLDGKAYVADAALETPAPRPSGAPPMIMAGGGGIDVWHFTLLRSGTSTLAFGLFAPGRTGAAQAVRTARFTINAFPRPELCP